MNDKMELLEYAKLLSNEYSTFISTESLKYKIWDTFEGDIPDEYKYCKVSPREFINEFLLKNFPNEIAIKSSFINQILLKNINQVSIFEFNVGKSRLDLCKIGLYSTAYEIKTDFDTPKRLEQQMNDYFKVFEKVYLICSVNNFERMVKYLPNECGVYTYKVTKNGRYIFKRVRLAQSSNKISVYDQLLNLTKKDLYTHFKSPYLSIKEDMVKFVLDNYSEKDIKKKFKICVKFKYQNKWEFFVKHIDEILEIDYQWFFKNNISPRVVYL